jgi:hypothetical protein
MVKMLQMEVVMSGMNRLRRHSELRKCLYRLLSDNLGGIWFRSGKSGAAPF